MTGLVRVERIAPLDRAVRDATELPNRVVNTATVALECFIDQEIDGSRAHTQRMALPYEGDRLALTVVFFVDVDGTLNVESIELGGPGLGRGVGQLIDR